MSEILTRLREQKGLSGAELARSLGVSRQCVHKILLGKMKLPTRLIPKTAEILEIDPGILLKAISYDFDEEIAKKIKP